MLLNFKEMLRERQSEGGRNEAEAANMSAFTREIRIKLSSQMAVIRLKSLRAVLPSDSGPDAL